jgi:hypothetical protein
MKIPICRIPIDRNAAVYSPGVREHIGTGGAAVDNYVDRMFSPQRVERRINALAIMISPTSAHQNSHPHLPKRFFSEAAATAVTRHVRLLIPHHSSSMRPAISRATPPGSTGNTSFAYSSAILAQRSRSTDTATAMAFGSFLHEHSG